MKNRQKLFFVTFTFLSNKKRQISPVQITNANKISMLQVGTVIAYIHLFDDCFLQMEIEMKKFEVYYTSGNYESEILEGESVQEVETDVVNFHMDDIDELHNGDIEAWKKETGLTILIGE